MQERRKKTKHLRTNNMWGRISLRKKKVCIRCGELNNRVLKKDEFACGKFKRHSLVNAEKFKTPPDNEKQKKLERGAKDFANRFEGVMKELADEAKEV